MVKIWEQTTVTVGKLFRQEVPRKEKDSIMKISLFGKPREFYHQEHEGCFEANLKLMVQLEKLRRKKKFLFPR